MGVPCWYRSMSVERILWKCEPRTKVKLEILNLYLGAWFGILANKGFEGVAYLDGFCGPGEYEDGEIGSPVIAIRHANAMAARYPPFSAVIICIDEDERKLTHLKSLKDVGEPHPNVRVEITSGTFESQVIGIFDRYDVPEIWPTFSFVDPFGFGESPYEILVPLVRNKSSELFINFMCGFMNRFKEHPDPDITEQIQRMVGTANLNRVVRATDPIGELCEVYREGLLKIGKFALRFMMRDERNVRDNAFFFCGNHARGFEKIKQAMWKVDPIHGNMFSAYKYYQADAGQRKLFPDQAYTEPLREAILKKYSGHNRVLVYDLNKWTIEQTETFLPTHLKTELENLLDKRKITYADPQPTGRKRAKGQWPERLLISFK